MILSVTYEWSVVGAGPAGIAALGELLDSGVDAKRIAWIDPHFQVGDFGRYWGEVSSNTTVKLFLEFLKGYRAFSYSNKPKPFAIDDFKKEDSCLLKHVAEPLQWITDHLKMQVITHQTEALELEKNNGIWNLITNTNTIKSKKVILATGAEPKSLPHHDKVIPIEIYDALNPSKLAKICTANDTVAVFGSSHSSMIIIRTLLELGIKKVINFYLLPIKFAVPMAGWILYDNTGLKAETARWVRENITLRCLPTIERYLSTEFHINQHLPQCTKAVYAIGFSPRTPRVSQINLSNYDAHTGVIAPGLFGAGIAFPRQITTPLGDTEMNVGLRKFMNDIRVLMPIWARN